MAKLSLCMIVKDEAAALRRCLESIADAVDEIIVVDTGSSDNTPQVAQDFGAKLSHFAWNDDFSAARNHSLMSATGDWILCLDADETLDLQSKEYLRQTVADPQTEGYFIKILNRLDGPAWESVRPDLVFRLFRNRKEYRFEHAIHEQIVDSILAKNPKAALQINENIVIWHDGFREQNIAAGNKRRRNLELLSKELRKDPENQMLRFHYGEELFYQKHYQEAIVEFRKAAYRLNPHVHFAPKLIRQLITSYILLNDYGAALQMVKYGLSHLPFFTDLHFIGGLASIGIGDFTLAREYFNNAVHTPEQPAHYSPVHGTRGFLTFYQLGNIEEELMNRDAALDQYIHSYKDNPDYTPALEKIVYLLNPRKNPVRARVELEKINSFTTPLRAFQLGKILFAQSAFSLALDYLERAKQEPALIPTVQIWSGVCLFQAHQYESSNGILKSFLPDSTHYVTANVDLLLNYWLIQDLDQFRAIRKILDDSDLTPDVKALIQTLQKILERVNHIPTSPATITPLSLKSEGIAAFYYSLIRALDFNQIQLAQTLVKALAPEQAGELAQRIGANFQNYGHLDIAADFFRRHLVANPSSSETYYSLGQVHKEQQKWVEAVNDYRLALACNQDGLAKQEPRYYLALIQSYQHLRQHIKDNALQNFANHPHLTHFKEA